MTDYNISVDAGNGGVNAVLDKGGGKQKSVYFPSVRAAATGDSLGLGKDLELQYEYVDWNGHRYVVGDDVLKVTRRNMERHTGANRYGGELHQFLIATAIAKLGIKSGKVGLTLFAPPGMYNEAKQTMQQYFMGQAGDVTIQLSSDGKPRHWQYDQLRILPEGIGAAACFILDDTGQMVKTDLFGGEVLLLDFGAYTLDALKMTDGNFNPESLEHATWENGGVISHILEPIRRAVNKMGDDFTIVTNDDIDRVIRYGLQSDDYTLTVAGQEIDLGPLVVTHSLRYAEWVANTIIDGIFAGLRGIKAIILVGGGALFVEAYLQEWYGDKVVNRRKHPTTKRIHPTDFNCVGGARWAIFEANNARKR